MPISGYSSTNTAPSHNPSAACSRRRARQNFCQCCTALRFMTSITQAKSVCFAACRNAEHHLHLPHFRHHGRRIRRVLKEPDSRHAARPGGKTRPCVLQRDAANRQHW